MESFRYHLESKTPLLSIQTCEESRLRYDLAADCRSCNYTLYHWTLDGLVKVMMTDQGYEFEPVNLGQVSLPEAIRAFGSDALPEKSCFMMPDVHLLDLKQYDVIRSLKDFSAIGKNTEKCIVIIGVTCSMPKELEKEVWALEYALPNEDELRVVLEKLAASTHKPLNGNTEALLNAGKGLTLAEYEQALAFSWAKKHDLDASIVQAEKCAAISKGGMLEIISAPSTLADIGGMQDLKDWLLKRTRCFSREAVKYGLPMPKGVLLVGPPGSGKSLTAKAAASALNRPLVRVDAGKFYSSLVGSSEENVRRVIDTLEAIAPCVAWFDEIEKSLSGSRSSGSTDGGTSARVFGTLLTWMSEKKSPVFIMATANDISALPPELLRKGRWDELFFVDLPEHEDRLDIWRIQISKYGRNPNEFDLDSLAKATTGFTGAEIESLFCEALYSAFNENREPNEKDIEDALSKTVPLSKTMAREIESLRNWANGRARRASTVKPITLQSSGRKLAA